MLLRAALLVGLAGCPADEPPGASDSTPGDTAEGLPGIDPPWTRDEVASPGSVTFSELAYNPGGDGELEWIELYNPMVYELDLSGWALDGAVVYTFAEGTRIGPGGYLVVAADPVRLSAEAGLEGALGPYTGRLDDDGARLDLMSNGGRRIDSMRYGDDDPWPVAADGSGATLTKLREDTASDHAENWTASPALGGTPGAAGGVDPATPGERIQLITPDAEWAYDDSGAEPDGDWSQATFDDGAWARGPAPFTAGPVAGTVEATLRITADNYYGAYLGAADGSGLRLVAEDPDGDWTSVDSFTLDVGARDHLYIAAWEAPWDDGGPQMTMAEVELDGGVVGTGIDAAEWILGAVEGCPGTAPTDPPPDVDELAGLVAAAESSAEWAEPAVEADRAADPWGWALSSAFDADTRSVWVDTFGSVSVTNTDNTYALFRTVDPLRGRLGATELGAVPTTVYFRAPFTFDADPTLATLLVDCQLDDGAVVYLNGAEVLRVNLPGGAVGATTLAAAAVDDEGGVAAELDTTALMRGENVLAVELHQAADPDDDLRFACALSARVTASGRAAGVRIDELPAGDVAPFWVELRAPDDAGADTSGLVLATSGGQATELGSGALAAGERLLVPDVGFSPDDGEVLYLYNADQTMLLDAVRVTTYARARDGQAQWRNPTEPTPGVANRIDVTTAVVVSEILYNRGGGSAEEWIELENHSAGTVDLSGWQLVDAVGYAFPEGTSLAPDGRLVVAKDPDPLRAAQPGATVFGPWAGTLDNGTDRILLLDARGNPADEVRYFDGGQWPGAADGGGSSLELRDVRADNAVGGAWAASDERSRGEWVQVRYQGDAEPSAVGPDGAWHELVVGLLDAGEVLIDDLSVVQDPDTAPVELVQDGSFDDAASWRLLGTHRHSEVVPDPDDGGNPVLRLVATGPTEHMHNHAETTLSRPISTREYAISFRARWVSGSNQLHTRLYFNRLPRTTLLDRPQDVGTPGAANSTADTGAGPTFVSVTPSVAVPAAGEPVVVRASVGDPDGVARVSLWSRVDGGTFTAAAMEPDGDGTWRGTLDGQPAGTLVQLYVDAEDDAGNVATWPAAGPDSRALLQWDDGKAASNGLHNLRLLMTEADSDWLLDDPNLMSNDRVGATVVYDEAQVYWDVGVRTKGSERGRPETLRLGYGLQFPRDAPFRGSHTSVLIDRSEGVGYGQREVLANLVGARVGLVSAEYNDLAHVMTPRPEHTGGAELQLDRFSDLVLAAQFADGADGSLFDYELVYYPLTTDDGTPEGLKLPQPDSVIGTPITDLGDDPEAWRWTFGLQNNLDLDDYSAMLALGQTFAQDDDDFLATVADIIDVDQWLRGYAFATLVGAVDNYAGDGSQHNARLYVRPDDRRVLLFPHDMDFFGGPTNAVVGNGDLARLLDDPLHRRTYHQHLQDLLERAYNPTYLGPWCDRFAELLPAQDFASHCGFVEDRAAYVLLDAPDAVLAEYPVMEFAITTGGGADFSTPDAETELRGQGWIDVREIALDGATLAVSWLDDHTWSVTVPLAAGVNDLRLVAVDLGGDEVGSDRVRVTRE